MIHADRRSACRAARRAGFARRAGARATTGTGGREVRAALAGRGDGELGRLAGLHLTRPSFNLRPGARAPGRCVVAGSGPRWSRPSASPRARGRPTRCSCITPSEAGAAFAAHAGAVNDQRDVRSGSPARRAPANAGRPDRLAARSWIGAAPEELVASYAARAGGDRGRPAAGRWRGRARRRSTGARRRRPSAAVRGRESA